MARGLPAAAASSKWKSANTGRSSAGAARAGGVGLPAQLAVVDEVEEPAGETDAQRRPARAAPVTVRSCAKGDIAKLVHSTRFGLSELGSARPPS
mmetsp:Transcript_95427/g.279047  ORF Transcript_95427/g.279047 Transcript_95427/m.279047 type:complete len:95 (+) Transcript_95427:193-477(+)